jgi:hypothetical protein
MFLTNNILDLILRKAFQIILSKIACGVFSTQQKRSSRSGIFSSNISGKSCKACQCLLHLTAKLMAEAFYKIDECQLCKQCRTAQFPGLPAPSSGGRAGGFR